MNVEVQNLDTLRKIVRSLQKENKELKELLDKSKIPYGEGEAFSTSLAAVDNNLPDESLDRRE
jgi:cell shape-determining protein MreC